MSGSTFQIMINRLDNCTASKKPLSGYKTTLKILILNGLNSRQVSKYQKVTHVRLKVVEQEQVQGHLQIWHQWQLQRQVPGWQLSVDRESYESLVLVAEPLRGQALFSLYIINVLSPEQLEVGSEKQTIKYVIQSQAKFPFPKKVCPHNTYVNI